MRCADGSWCIDDLCSAGAPLCGRPPYPDPDLDDDTGDSLVEYVDDEATIDLGGGMVVPLRELLDDEQATP